MKRPFQVTMRWGEIIGGVIWLAIYGFFMGDILSLALGLLGISYTTAQLNALFFLCNFVITALVFRRFLTKNLMLVPGNLLRTLKGMLVGFCIYWLLQVGIGIIGDLLSGNIDIPNDDTIASIADENYRIMWAGSGAAGPHGGGNPGAGVGVRKHAAAEPGGGLCGGCGGVCSHARAELSGADGCPDPRL